MSHCTSFDFQYTNRELIIRTFEKLGLKWSNETVFTYASSFAKTMGIASEERPAIIAQCKGFNYFMEDFGNHYELSVEKHNMSWTESNYAKQLGREFQKLYVEETAQQFVNQMTQNGTNCLLDKTDSGCIIRFGTMYEKSILIKLDNGRVVEEVQGVKGNSCVSITEALENMLSSQDVQLDTEWTSEYYEDPTDGLSIYNLEQN